MQAPLPPVPPSGPFPASHPSALHRRRNLVLLFSANMVSGFAQGITLIAIPWYIVSAPHPVWAGMANADLNAQLVGAVQLATVVWSLFSGTLVDRYNRKHLFLAINLGGALLQGLAAASGWWNPLPGLPVLAAGMLVTYFIHTVHYPNMYAFVQELFEPADYGRVNSAVEFQGQLTNALGMAMGGLLLQGTLGEARLPLALQFDAWTLHRVLALDALTYVLSFALLAFIHYTPVPKPASAYLPFAQRLGGGIRFLNRERALAVVGIVGYVIFFGVMVFYPVLLPLYIRDVLHEGGLLMGLAESTHALGALVAAGMALALQPLLRRIHKVAAMVAMVVVAALLFLALVWAPNSTLLLVITACLGFVNSMLRILRWSYLLRVIPNHLIGRVNAVFSISNGLLRAGFLLLLPVLLGHLPPSEWAFSGLTTLSVLLVLAATWLGSTWRRLNHTAAYG